MAPERIETSRLVLRRPTTADVDAVFARYASDPEVTRLLSWPTHRSIVDTRAFLDFSDFSWGRWDCGPYLIESRASGGLLGGTGLTFESATSASTGYVLARDAWGQGYATEALQAMIDLAPTIGIERLYALVHVDHAASVRVLEKSGFKQEGRLASFAFPNLGADQPHQAVSYARTFT